MGHVTIEQVKRMVDRYFEDTSRTAQETADGLNELLGYVGEYYNTLIEDGCV